MTLGTDWQVFERAFTATNGNKDLIAGPMIWLGGSIGAVALKDVMFCLAQ